MEELLKTIDFLINNGTPVEDLAVINKRTLKAMYIEKSKVRKKIDKTKFYIPEYQGEFVAIEDLEKIL